MCTIKILLVVKVCLNKEKSCPIIMINRFRHECGGDLQQVIIKSSAVLQFLSFYHLTCQGTSNAERVRERAENNGDTVNGQRRSQVEDTKGQGGCVICDIARQEKSYCN